MKHGGFFNAASRTGTPGLSASLVTSLLAHGIRLTLVLRHAGVDSPERFVSLQSPSSSGSCSLSTYCTMSGRIGALKTLGSGWVSLVGAPSPPWMVTVGRLVIVAVLLVGRCAELLRDRKQSLQQTLEIWRCSVCRRFRTLGMVFTLSHIWSGATRALLSRMLPQALIASP